MVYLHFFRVELFRIVLVIGTCHFPTSEWMRMVLHLWPWWPISRLHRSRAKLATILCEWSVSSPIVTCVGTDIQERNSSFYKMPSLILIGITWFAIEIGDCHWLDFPHFQYKISPFFSLQRISLRQQHPKLSWLVAWCYCVACSWKGYVKYFHVGNIYSGKNNSCKLCNVLASVL